MRRLGWLFIVIAFSIPSFSQTPEVDALLDAIFAKDIDSAAKHLPLTLQKAITELPQQERNAIGQRILVLQHMQREGSKITRAPGNDVLLSIQEPRGDTTNKVEFRLEKRISDGNEAILRISISENADQFNNSFEVWMRYEDGDWRVYEISAPESHSTVSLDDPKLLDELRETPRSNHSEASAVGSLRSYNTAIVTYEATYPEIGAPSSFDVLGSLGGDNNPSEYHAGLLDPTSTSPPYRKFGYQFAYRRGSSSDYEIVARPVDAGSGKRSFFTDQTGVIRSTEEDREPNAQDSPLN